MIIEEDIKLDFKDVLIKPKRSTLSSRKEVDLTREYTFKYSIRTFNGIPIIAANMDTIGTIDMCEALHKMKLVTALHKHICSDQIDKLLKAALGGRWSDLVFCSIGISNNDFSKFEEIYATNSNANVCIDVANGYSEHFAEFVSKVRKKFPDIIIMAGNVVTSEMTEQLILSGADIVKVGIGPGSVCTTRKQTGVGYPQLSAIIECADAAHGLGGLVCADGGCTVPGDVAKAFGAGADFVMLGGMLAGHDECGGTTIEYVDEQKTTFDIANDCVYPVDQNLLSGLKDGVYKIFYGMSSETAMDKHHGGVAEYRSSEGKTVLVPYRGHVADTVKDILGGLRSTCTYVGAKRLKDLSKCTTFVRVTQQINNVFR